MEQIQSKKCKEDFNLLKSRVYNDYPLCKKLKKANKQTLPKTNTKTKTSNKTAQSFKMFNLSGHKTTWTLSSSAETLDGYPNKNTFSNTRKIESARGTMGRGKGGSFLSFPFPSCHTRFLCHFILPSFPTTQRGLCGGESDMKIQQQTFRTFLVFLLVKVHVTENE